MANIRQLTDVYQFTASYGFISEFNRQHPNVNSVIAGIRPTRVPQSLLSWWVGMLWGVSVKDVTIFQRRHILSPLNVEIRKTGDVGQPIR
ncbi:hypothetical protein [Streptomyces nigrescens]|uniref:Uncharacterized protein n=1 Tax=Streptomyces nigrescens TaxID=1920 RepID=A0ABY7J0W0_STRNI|nr:hypothetical protein [Streptomyces nigrescens]WAU03784.1 hypothetical protein STRNI_001970 [Streptomyces nigrescens]